ncbi:hypothetical protein Tco_0875402 [Tanacetum coccineum]|uniref:Uncharacterized protein n=1 Tax=Tanacetum coccineum TaxID=301880 RepID=A0ABQ5BS89_9ASTR
MPLSHERKLWMSTTGKFFSLEILSHGTHTIAYALYLILLSMDAPIESDYIQVFEWTYNYYERDKLYGLCSEDDDQNGESKVSNLVYVETDGNKLGWKSCLADGNLSQIRCNVIRACGTWTSLTKAIDILPNLLGFCSFSHITRYMRHESRVYSTQDYSMGQGSAHGSAQVDDDDSLMEEIPPVKSKKPLNRASKAKEKEPPKD